MIKPYSTVLGGTPTIAKTLLSLSSTHSGRTHLPKSCMQGENSVRHGDVRIRNWKGSVCVRARACEYPMCASDQRGKQGKRTLRGITIRKARMD